MTAVSWSVAATPQDTSATSITIPPPPLYAAGNLLVMAVTGGANGGVSPAPSTPSGWTALSASGAALGVFTRTATGSESGYTVTMAAACCISACVAAYPAATVTAHSFGTSASGVTSYTSAYPSGVTSSQVVLVPAGAIASGGNAGYQNVVCPSGLNPVVPVFGPALPTQPVSPVSPCAAGLYDVTGAVMSGLPAPVFTSPQPARIYAGYVVLTVTGAAPSALAVTATSTGVAAMPGLALTVKALTGAASPAAVTAGGATAKLYPGGTSQAPQASITPNGTGSIVYGAVTENFAVTSGSSFTANGSTVFSQDVADTAFTAAYGTLQSAGTTTASSPVTLGGSAPASGYFTLALAEILAASGGTLSEVSAATVAGTVPGAFPTPAVAQTAYLTPAPAADDLIVAMVSANSNWRSGSNPSVTVTDSSGLVWTPLIEVHYPSYAGVWIGALASGGGTSAILDEAGNPILDESGAAVLDESGTVTGTTVFGPAAQVSARATAGSAPGPATATAIARVTVRAVPGTAGSGIATGAILDEAGNPILDEAGNPILDESGGGSGPAPPPPPPVLTGAWTAARAGLPGDGTAENAAVQASQFLRTHQVTPVHAGARAWDAAGSAPHQNSFAWADGIVYLRSADIAQPFALQSGTTATGRVAVPLAVTGSGAGLTVTLCPDNGSGAPETSAVLAAATVPASHVSAVSATGSLATAGPLQVSRYNASFLGQLSTRPWAPGAVSSGGAGNYATPVTAGNYTVFLGGEAGGSTPVSTVSLVQYQGSGTVSGAVPGPPLPQPAWEVAATATSDTIVLAGGWTGAAYSTGAWTATWDGAGTIGAWTLQAPLPVNCGSGAMASSGENVYVLAGTPDGTTASASGLFYWAAVSGGGITAWNAGPRLPEYASSAYLACAGNWLIAAGGLDTSGNALARVYVAKIGSDGTPGSWQAGPSLPVPAYAYAPQWNLVVTDSAVIIVSGLTTGSGYSSTAMSLTVSPDGPAPEWQVQGWVSSAAGIYQMSAFPSGAAGNWTAVGYHPASYDTAPVYPVPMVSVPLPAAGLTPAATYYVVLHQDGGDTADWLQPGLLAAGAGACLFQPDGTGPWFSTIGWQVGAVVYDSSATGALLHLYEDAGARVTTMVRDSSGDLIGIADSTAFPAASPEAVLPAVTQVQWSGGVPSALVQLA